MSPITAAILSLLTLSAGFGLDYWIIGDTMSGGGHTMHPGAAILLGSITFAVVFGVIAAIWEEVK